MYCIGAAIAFFGTAAVHVVFGFGEDAAEAVELDDAE